MDCVVMHSTTPCYWSNSTIGRHSFTPTPQITGSNGHKCGSPSLLRRHNIAIGTHQQQFLSEEMGCHGKTQNSEFDIIDTLNNLHLCSDDNSIHGDDHQFVFPPGFDSHSQNKESSACWRPAFFQKNDCFLTDGLPTSDTSATAALRSIWSDKSTNSTIQHHRDLPLSINSTLENTTRVGGVPVSPLPTFNRCGAIGEGRRRISTPTSVSTSTTTPSAESASIAAV